LFCAPQGPGSREVLIIF